MIQVRLIGAHPKELRELIRFAYEGDQELIAKYQAGDRDFDECVDFNCCEIIDRMNDEHYKGCVNLWKVILQSGDEMTDIGYCVTIKKEGEVHWLYSFGINIHYRKSVFLVDWLREVENLLGVPFYTALWTKNERAINFFRKNGFTDKQTPDKTFRLLFKRYDLIPKRQRRLWQLV